MDKRRRRKHQAHKGALVVVNEHRPYLEATPGGRNVVGMLDRTVRRQAARFSDQEGCRMQRRAAVERCRKARRMLHAGLRLITTVIRIVNGSPRVTGARITNDVQLIARVDSVLAAAASQADALVSRGLPPGFLRRMADELAAFKMAKNAVTLAVAQFTEAAEAFDLAHEDARKAILILEGILTSADAPVGALNALLQAKRIGPRAQKPEIVPPLLTTGTNDQRPTTND